MYVSEKCKKVLLPSMCYYFFKPCVKNARTPTPREICRKDCQALKNDICKREMSYIQGSKIKIGPSDCKALPGPSSPGHSTCLSIGAAGELTEIKNCIELFQNFSGMDCRVNGNYMQGFDVRRQQVQLFWVVKLDKPQKECTKLLSFMFLAQLNLSIVDRTNWLWSSTNLKRSVQSCFVFCWTNRDRVHCFVLRVSPNVSTD